jgi:hypothetical protein
LGPDKNDATSLQNDYEHQKKNGRSSKMQSVQQTTTLIESSLSVRKNRGENGAVASDVRESIADS